MDVYEESVDRRLSLYSLNKVFPTYVAQLQQVHSLVHRLLTQNLNENDKLAVEYINELKDSLNLKYLEVKNSIDTDRSSYNALDISVERTLDTIKYKLEKYLPEVRSLRDELEERNDRLNQMHTHIMAFNEESVNLNTRTTTLKHTKEEWIEILNDSGAFQKLFDGKVFKKVGDDLFSVTEELFDGEMELKHMNMLMKKDIERLKIDLDSYKKKWLDNYDVMSKISVIVKDRLKERRTESGTNEEDYEEEEEDQEVERVKNDQMYESEGDSSFNSEEENQIFESIDDNLDEDQENGELHEEDMMERVEAEEAEEADQADQADQDIGAEEMEVEPEQLAQKQLTQEQDEQHVVQEE